MAPKLIVLITGCSRGSLGDALAQAFSNRGWHVFATSRNEAKLSHFKDKGINTLIMDVCDENSITACREELSSKTNGKLDMLINNAGGLYAMPLADASLTESRKLFDLNVWSYLAVTQAFLPLLIPSRGTLVNQTSISSVTNVPYNGIYNASKAAAAMLTDTLRLELEPFSIKVMELKTGAVKSGFYQNQNSGVSSRLPQDSIYAPAREPVERSMTGVEVEAGAISADAWANEVATELIKGDSPRIWKGHNAFPVRFARRVMGPDFLDGNMRKMGNLDEVKRALTSTSGGSG